MNRPLIGVPWSAPAANDRIPRLAYLRALEQAGAAPVLIPPAESPVTLGAVLERLDGLLLPGGPDVDPRHYREEAIAGLNKIDGEADRQELQLARAALAARKPLLGVCRGQQLLNVALGGTLYQDLRTQQATEVDHTGSRPVARDHLVHPVRLEPGSRLAALIGGAEIAVNSLHHQGIKTLAPGLRAVAWSPDGVIEAVEGEGRFCLAVQWHPEELLAHAWALHLFQAFVRASAGNVVVGRPRDARQA